MPHAVNMIRQTAHYACLMDKNSTCLTMYIPETCWSNRSLSIYFPLSFLMCFVVVIIDVAVEVDVLFLPQRERLYI